MAKYFRVPFSGDPSKTYGYNVVGEKTVDTTDWEGNPSKEYPTGKIRVSYSRDKYTPYWDDKSITGLSSQFLGHVYDDLDMSDDQMTNLIGKSNKSLGPLIKSVSQMYYEGDEDVFTTPGGRRELQKVHQKFHPETLFHHEPARTTINEADVHESLRHTFPVMAQLIKQDYPNHRLTAAHDLSPHSSKLSKAAHKRGLVDPHPYNPSFKVTNNMDFSDSNTISEVDSVHAEVSEERVKRAKGELRETLRGQSPKKSLSPQFDHPTLFDTEK